VSSESREAQIEALLARIGAFVDGRDLPGWPSELELRAASFELRLAPLMEQFGTLVESISEQTGISPEAFMCLLEDVGETGKLPPVPAKAAHRKKFVR
jgi:hypothetical protein